MTSTKNFYEASYEKISIKSLKEQFETPETNYELVKKQESVKEISVQNANKDSQEILEGIQKNALPNFK